MQSEVPDMLHQLPWPSAVRGSQPLIVPLVVGPTVGHPVILLGQSIGDKAMQLLALNRFSWVQTCSLILQIFGFMKSCEKGGKRNSNSFGNPFASAVIMSPDLNIFCMNLPKRKLEGRTILNHVGELRMQNISI